LAIRALPRLSTFYNLHIFCVIHSSSMPLATTTCEAFYPENLTGQWWHLMHLINLRATSCLSILCRVPSPVQRLPTPSCVTGHERFFFQNSMLKACNTSLAISFSFFSWVGIAGHRAIRPDRLLGLLLPGTLARNKVHARIEIGHATLFTAHAFSIHYLNSATAPRRASRWLRVGHCSLCMPFAISILYAALVCSNALYNTAVFYRLAHPSRISGFLRPSKYIFPACVDGGYRPRGV
jgi:hypothetical protein